MQHQGIDIPSLAARLSATVVETHASWILLAGDMAWKLKKPITLPFLDYGTREKRVAACAEELRLNRRWAPGLYLDVVTLDGEPAVLMRRFDEAGRLDHLCRRGELMPAHLTGLARALVAFQAQAPAAIDSAFGSPDLVRAEALENFDELERLLPAGDAAQLATLRCWTAEEFSRCAPEMARRKAEGRVLEGHGDLHLGNLVLIDGTVVPFDGIEFSANFRWIDVASELAFAVVDLLDHGRPGLACWLLNAWLEASGDYGAMAVLRYYAVYRAMVRAKVAAIRAGQEDGAGRARDLAQARDYLALAQRLAVPPAPTLVITCGLSGSGKTTRSSETMLAAGAGLPVRIRSDVERKRLHGFAADADSGGTIYGTEATRRTYDALAEIAGATLAAGWPVIVDAAFLRRAERDGFRALADRHRVPFGILYCEAPADELRSRLAARRGDASEATVEVMERQREWLEAPGPDEPVINPSSPREST